MRDDVDHSLGPFEPTPDEERRCPPGDDADGGEAEEEADVEEPIDVKELKPARPRVRPKVKPEKPRPEKKPKGDAVCEFRMPVYEHEVAEGDIVSSSQETGAVSYSDRAFFKALRASDRDDLFVSEPVLGRVSGQWRIPMALRIVSEGGRFGGVVVMSVDPTNFTDFYRQADLGAQGLLELADLAYVGPGVFASAAAMDKAMAKLLRRAGINAKPQEVSADSAQVQALIGERAPYQAPAAKPVQPVKAQGPKRTPAPRSGGQPRRSGGRRGSRGQARSGSSRAART